MCSLRLSRKLTPMTTTSRSGRLPDRLAHLPAGARAGLLATAVAASLALFGAGAQASPIKDAPTGPSVLLEAQAGAAKGAISFVFKSETASDFECSLDDTAFAKCASPVEVAPQQPGNHSFRVHALDRSGTAGAPAESFWQVGPLP